MNLQKVNELICRAVNEDEVDEIFARIGSQFREEACGTDLEYKVNILILEYARFLMDNAPILNDGSYKTFTTEECAAFVRGACEIGINSSDEEARFYRMGNMLIWWYNIKEIDAGRMCDGRFAGDVSVIKKEFSARFGMEWHQYMPNIVK